MKQIISLFLALFLFSCTAKKIPAPVQMQLSYEEIHFFDSARNRDIPVAVMSKNENLNENLALFIFSHGYGRNNPGSNTEYNYLFQSVANEGYAVFSIQHELPTDDLLPLEGNPQILRRPNWERGAENINFVLKELKKKYPNLNYDRVVVAGHSNGGDMSVLFATKHPDEVWKLITLDQRRFAFPLLTKPKIYSLRSSDQAADSGVIPSTADQKKFGMTILKLPRTIHNDMDDSGTVAQKAEIVNYFLQFLRQE